MNTLFKLIAAASLLAPIVANAGKVYNDPLVIDFENQYAMGSMKAARYSDDPEAYIGCGMRYRFDVDGHITSSWGFCQAAMSPDVYAICYTESPEVLDKMSRITPWAFIVFRWQEGVIWDEEENICTHISFSTQSFHLPDNNAEKDKDPRAK